MAKHRIVKRTFVLLILLALLFVSAAHATFSIVGYDPETKEWGVAVASRQVAVGAAVPWAQAGSGAVAVQGAPLALPILPAPPGSVAFRVVVIPPTTTRRYALLR